MQVYLLDSISILQSWKSRIEKISDGLISRPAKCAVHYPLVICYIAIENDDL